MIIDNAVRALVERIENPTAGNISSVEADLMSLVQLLDNNCQKPEVKERYQNYAQNKDTPIATTGKFSEYPIGTDGYAVAFDPLENEEAFWNCWSQYGLVVGKAAASPRMYGASIQRVHQIVDQLSHGKFSIDDPATYESMPVDDQGTPIISRGFFEVYHDDSLAQLRQSLRLYLHHVVIHGRADLWTSFDRYGVKLAGHKESAGLPLHVDQNPTVHPNFRTTQGVLALTDCPVERGTFVAVPGSREFFHEYSKLVHARGDDYRGEFVELQKTVAFAKNLEPHAQAIPLRAGDIVSWDSRTTHANSPNLSGEARIVAYISAGPSPKQNPGAILARQAAFRTGEGSNMRDALMHASKKPRYNNLDALKKIRKPEQLNALGRLLYGI